MLLRTCLLCAAPSREHLCAACKTELPWNTLACVRCALPLANTHDTTCGECSNKPLHCDRTISSFTYSDPIDYWISQFKFQQQLVYGRMLSQLLLDTLKTAYAEQPLPQLILPVPLHRKRLIERGYNQALELAKPLSKQLRIPLDYKLAERTRNTAHQTELEFKDRAKNVRRAFTVTQPLPVTHVAVLDDVITTGHTINAFCEALRQVGAKRIDVWCVARTTSSRKIC